MQLGEHPIQHTLPWSSDSSVYASVLVFESLGQAAPLTTMLRDIQDGVDDLEIGHADIAALNRQATLNLRELLGGDFHATQYSAQID